MRQLSRREVLKAGVVSAVLARTATAATFPVYLIRTTSREEGIRRGLAALGLPAARGKRVAVDAVGVAILRMHGGNATISRGRVFEQEQIARAVQLGLGVKGPEQIDLVTEDAESKKLAERIREILTRG